MTLCDPLCRQRGESDEGESPCPSAGGAAPSAAAASAGMAPPPPAGCPSGSLHSMRTGGPEAAATVGGALERFPSRASIQGPHATHDGSWPAAMEVEHASDAGQLSVPEHSMPQHSVPQHSVPQHSAPQHSLPLPGAPPLHPLHPFPDYSRSAGVQLPPLMLSVPPPAQPSRPGGQPGQDAAMPHFPATVSLPIPTAPAWTPAAAALPRQTQHCGAWGSPGLSPLAQCSSSLPVPVPPAHGGAAAWPSPAPGMGAADLAQQQQQPGVTGTPQCHPQQFQLYTAAVVARSGAAAGPVAAAVTNTAVPSPPMSGSQGGSPTASLPQSGQVGSAPTAACQSLASADAEPPCPLPYDRLQRQRMSSSGTDVLPLGGAALPPLPAPMLAYIPPQGLQLAGAMPMLPGLGGDSSIVKQERASTAADLQHLLALLGSGAVGGGAAAGEALPSGFSGLQLGSGGNSGNGSPSVPLAGLQPSEQGKGRGGGSQQGMRCGAHTAHGALKHSWDLHVAVSLLNRPSPVHHRCRHGASGGGAGGRHGSPPGQPACPARPACWQPAGCWLASAAGPVWAGRVDPLKPTYY